MKTGEKLGGAIMAYIKKIHIIISKGFISGEFPEKIDKEAIKNIGQNNVDLITLLTVDCIGNTIGIAVSYDKDLDCCLTRILTNSSCYTTKFLNAIRYITEDHHSYSIEPYEYPSFSAFKKALIDYALFILDKRYKEGKFRKPTAEDAIYGPLIMEGNWYHDIILNNALDHDNAVAYQETFCQPQRICLNLDEIRDKAVPF